MSAVFTRRLKCNSLFHLAGLQHPGTGTWEAADLQWENIIIHLWGLQFYRVFYGFNIVLRWHCIGRQQGTPVARKREYPKDVVKLICAVADPSANSTEEQSYKIQRAEVKPSVTCQSIGIWPTQSWARRCWLSEALRGNVCMGWKPFL